MELENRVGPHAGFEFAHDLGAVRSARALVQTTLPAGPLRDDVERSVSELVTNVVKHTRGGGLIRLWNTHPTVRVEVEDDSTQQPVLSDDYLAGFGRTGLAIVGLLCDAWGFSTIANGKVVWAEFHASSTSRTGDPRSA
jgi:signal transduction histidine kinase